MEFFRSKIKNGYKQGVRQNQQSHRETFPDDEVRSAASELHVLTQHLPGYQGGVGVWPQYDLALAGLAVLSLVLTLT